MDNQNEASSNIKLVLYGSIIYIVIHAFLSFSKSKILSKVKIYFWFILILDIVLTYMNRKNNNTTNNNNSKDNKFIKDIFDLKSNLHNILKISNPQSNNNVDIKLNKIETVKDNKPKVENEPNKKIKKENNPKTKQEPDIIEENKQENNKVKNISFSTPLSKIIKNNKNSKPLKNNLKKKDNIINVDKSIIKKSINSIETNNPIGDENENNNNENNHENDDKLFNDNSSLSGSEMDFDINEFENTLDNK